MSATVKQFANLGSPQSTVMIGSPLDVRRPPHAVQRRSLLTLLLRLTVALPAAALLSEALGGWHDAYQDRASQPSGAGEGARGEQAQEEAQYSSPTATSTPIFVCILALCTPPPLPPLPLSPRGRRDSASGVLMRGLYRVGEWPIKRHLRTIRH